jgi:hypothetical protein
MLKKMIMGFTLLLGLMVVIVVVACHSRDRTTVDGTRITIKSGHYHIEGILETPSTYQFLMKDEGVSIGTFSGNAFVTMMPLRTADRLRAQYGDFFKCNEPGALQAIQNMQATVLVAGGEEARWGIAEALALVRKSRIPVVSFSGSRIQVMKHTYLKMDVVDQTGTSLYYLSDFTILKPDYLQ